MNGNESKEFWIGLGKEIGESKECTKRIDEKLNKFMNNDHVHLCADVKELEGKIDKLALRIAYIVGGISALSFAVQIAVKLLSK